MKEDSYILKNYDGDDVNNTLDQVRANKSDISALSLSLYRERVERNTADSALSTSVGNLRKELDTERGEREDAVQELDWKLTEETSRATREEQRIEGLIGKFSNLSIVDVTQTSFHADRPNVYFMGDDIAAQVTAIYYNGHNYLVFYDGDSSVCLCKQGDSAGYYVAGQRYAVSALPLDVKRQIFSCYHRTMAAPEVSKDSNGGNVMPHWSNVMVYWNGSGWATCYLNDLPASFGNKTITGDKIADKAITDAKIADKTIKALQLADGAVITGRLADEAVTEKKIADNAVSIRKLADDVMATVTQADKELLDRMQGVSDNSNPYTDPFVLVRFVGDGFLEQFNTWLDDLHTVTSVADARKAGFFRISLYGSFCEVKNIALSWEAMKFQQIVEGNVYIDGQGKVASNDNRYTILQRRYDGSAWSEWQEDTYETRKTIANDLRAGYSGSDVSLSLYRGQSRLFGNAINAATEEMAGVMSAEDKIRQRTLGERIEAVNDAATAAIEEERTARKAADDALQEAIDEEAENRIYGDNEIKKEISIIAAAVPDEMRTYYSNDGVSIDLLHNDTIMYGDTIEPATETFAGVMSAEDKIEQRNIRTLVETFKKNLIPSGLTVSCLERITLGNVEPIYIKAELFPETVYRNIIYISDNKAVTVGTDGRVTPVSVGKSVISVIPTCNTSLAKTIIVEVGKPLARLVNNRATLRLTSSGAFRLT